MPGVLFWVIAKRIASPGPEHPVVAHRSNAKLTDLEVSARQAGSEIFCQQFHHNTTTILEHFETSHVR